MAYRALYRGYRPQTFDEVVGQKYIVQTLQNQLKNNKVSHAYIFTGPRGTGKTTIARLIAKGLNCTSFSKPCGECDNCKAIAEGIYPDVIEIDAASNNSVDNARDLIEKVKYAPVNGKYKVYIIDEVHMLTTSAFNALLKTFEEPPENVIFILATTDIQKVPATILSRCQRFDFGRISQKDLETKLNEVIEKEGVSVEDGVVNLIAALADGGVRDALGILDQAIAYQGNHISVQDVRDIYGVLSVKEAIDFLKIINSHDVTNALKTLDKFATKSVDIPRFTTMLIDILKETIVFNKTDSTANLALLNEDNVYEIADFLTSQTAFRYIDILLEANQSYKLVNTPRSYFELAILKLCDVESSIEVNHVTTKETVHEPIKDDQFIAKAETTINDEVYEEEVEEVEESSYEEQEDDNYSTSQQSYEEDQIEQKEEEIEEENITNDTTIQEDVVDRNPYDEEYDEEEEYEHKTVGDLIEELGAIDYDIADDWEGFEVYIPIYEEPMLEEYPTIILVEDGEPRLSTLEESFNYQRSLHSEENEEYVNSQVEETEPVEEETDEIKESSYEEQEDDNYSPSQQSYKEQEYQPEIEEEAESTEEPTSYEEQEEVIEEPEINKPLSSLFDESAQEEREAEPIKQETIEEKPTKVIAPATVTQEIMFNYLVQSDKQHRLPLVNIWNSLSKYVQIPKYTKAANSLRDGVIVAAGENCLVISMDLKAQAEIANSPEMYLENKELIEELFGREYKYIATYTDEFKSFLVKFKEAYLAHSLPAAEPIQDLYDIEELRNYKISSSKKDQSSDSDTVKDIFGDMLKIK